MVRTVRRASAAAANRAHCAVPDSWDNDEPEAPEPLQPCDCGARAHLNAAHLCPDCAAAAPLADAAE